MGIEHGNKMPGFKHSYNFRDHKIHQSYNKFILPLQSLIEVAGKVGERGGVEYFGSPLSSSDYFEAHGCWFKDFEYALEGTDGKISTFFTWGSHTDDVHVLACSNTKIPKRKVLTLLDIFADELDKHSYTRSH